MPLPEPGSAIDHLLERIATALERIAANTEAKPTSEPLTKAQRERLPTANPKKKPSMGYKQS